MPKRRTIPAPQCPLGFYWTQCGDLAHVFAHVPSDYKWCHNVYGAIWVIGGGPKLVGYWDNASWNPNGTRDERCHALQDSDMLLVYIGTKAPAKRHNAKMKRRYDEAQKFEGASFDPKKRLKTTFLENATQYAKFFGEPAPKLPRTMKG